MKKQDLIDRYVYAVVRHLPRRQAEDIDKELHGLIEDMLLARCQERPAEEKDVLVVLTELGTPLELAAQYSGDKERCLIGQPWYSQYKMVVKWVAVAFAFGISVALAVELVMAAIAGGVNPGAVGIKLLEWAGTLFSGVLCIIGMMTVLYAAMQRKGIRLFDAGLSESLTDLPPVPERKEKISRADAVCGIIFSILLMALFVFLPKAICGVFRSGGATEVIPLFNVQVVYSLWYLFAGMCICGVVSGVFELMEGRYTVRLAVVSGLCDLAGLILIIIFAGTDNILNPAFLSKAAEKFTGDAAWMGQTLFPNLLNIIVVVAAAATALNLATNLYKAMKYRAR